MQNRRKTTQTPYCEAYFVYGSLKSHCYGGPQGEHIMAHMPAGAVADRWKE